ncbi:MAG: hypothetical protein JKY65_15255 [Planctomycetes bacterium]|nr:hypothetical protein [Planctomycetota bacterium]
MAAKVGGAVGVLAFALIGGAILFSSKDPQPGAVASPTATVTETPKTSATLPKGPRPRVRETPAASATPRLPKGPRGVALARVKELEGAGDYKGALAKLLAMPESLRGPAFASKKTRIKRYAKYAETLASALTEGVDGSAFRRWVERIEGEEVEEDLAALSVTTRFTEKAREIAGPDYESIAAGEYEEEREDEGAIDGEMPWEIEREIERLGSEERRERMKAEATKGQERVEAARQALNARAKVRLGSTQAEAARAKAKCAKLTVPLAKGRSGTGPLVGYDERGFSVNVDGESRRFSWLGGPAELVCSVLERALDEKSPSDQRRLLRLACLRGDQATAKRARGRLKTLTPKASLPDEDFFQALAKVLVVGTLSETKLQANYRFESELEDYDFTALPGAETEIKGKSLRVLAKLPGLLPALVYHDSTLTGDTATFIVAGDPGPKGRLVLMLGGIYLVVNESGIATTETLRELNKIKLPGPGIKVSEAFKVVFKRSGKTASLTLSQNGKTLFEGPADADSAGYCGLGGTGAVTRYTRFEIRAQPDKAWLKSARAKIPFDCERSYRLWEWSQAPDEPDLSLVYAKTSAEDPECVGEVPPKALKLLLAARKLLAEVGEIYAAGPLRKAIDVSGGRGFWAAEYLMARIEMHVAADSAEMGGARIRLDQAIAGVEDFYEAHTARSELLLSAGALALAREDAMRALEIRPDYAPARSALAYVLLQEGKFDEAIAEIRLARELSGRIKWVLQEERLVAALEGPLFWNDSVRIETADYVFATDVLDRRDEFEEVLKRFQKLAPKVFPCLTPRPGSQVRRARIYVFAEQEGYRRYCYQIFFDRKESSVGVFSSRTGNLQLDASARDAVSTLQHEMTHQWVHNMGLELPYWASEAVADYIGGYDPAKKTSELDLEMLDSLAELKEPPMGLFDLMTLSPGEFYSGNTYLNYCLAWSFVHYAMEGDDATLKAALFAYLKEHNKGPAGDPKRQAGTALEYTYAATFHELDMKSVQVAWWAYVKALCKAHLPKDKNDAPEKEK